MQLLRCRCFLDAVTLKIDHSCGTICGHSIVFYGEIWMDIKMHYFKKKKKNDNTCERNGYAADQLHRTLKQWN